MEETVVEEQQAEAVVEDTKPVELAARPRII